MLLGLFAPELFDEATAFVREASDEDPAKAIVWTVLVGAQAFYKAEKGVNPKVRTLNDALVYVSTNLSVGYCDIFAMTERGKQIGTLLMTFGPALAARALDATAAEKRETDRAREFAPVKNAQGEDSPDASRRALTRLHASWLEAAGAKVPRDAAGDPIYPIEISPLTALSASDLGEKVTPGLEVKGALKL